MFSPKRIIIAYEHQTGAGFQYLHVAKNGLPCLCGCIVMYLLLEEPAAGHRLAVGGKTSWGPKISLARYQTEIAAASGCKNVNGFLALKGHKALIRVF